MSGEVRVRAVVKQDEEIHVHGLPYKKVNRDDGAPLAVGFQQSAFRIKTCYSPLSRSVWIMFPVTPRLFL